jgi:O-antigen ligase
VRSTAARAALSTGALLGPLAAPFALLLVGACIGYAFSLDRPVASERLVGIVLSGALSLCAAIALRSLTAPGVKGTLLTTAVVALLGGVWIISASGPDVFRGAVGNVLQAMFRPLFGAVQLTQSVDITNTWFIVGYNGLADVCLVAIFCAAAISRTLRLAWPIVAIGLVVLVGTGARGGLTGLAAGACAIGIFAWPRRYAVLALLAAPLTVAIAAAGVFDKGLEFSSTAGRLTYWADLARMLVEYPLTGVGLGVDTANRVALQYQINPDPERIFYAHNTFVQTYLEQGPLGVLGMLLLSLVAIAAALIARRDGIAESRRPVLVAGLGIVGGMQAHGLTDQVVTTNVGTAITLIGLAAIVCALSTPGQQALLRVVGWYAGVAVGVSVLVVLAVLLLPAARAQALLNLGGLQLNQALAMEPHALGRGEQLAHAESTLMEASRQNPTQPAILRELAAVRAARYEDDSALSALQQAATASGLDAFDRLQIAHVYLDLGWSEEAYTWAARAYADWGRAPEDAVMQVYAQSTLSDDRARTLTTQAEAAMRARAFGDAHALFQQALTFQPGNAYLVERVGAAQRAIERYGAGPPA